jgi:putative acyl-CoA dehydrogenase
MVGAREEDLNQSPPFVEVNLFTSDQALQEAVRREGAGFAEGDLGRFGARAGSAEALELGRLANENPPRLLDDDAQARGEMVAFHPAYHALMETSIGAGLHCSPHEHLLTGEAPRAGAHVARCAGSFMATQMEAGHCCPITMTHAAVASLRHAPSVAEDWLPKILRRAYDPSSQPLAAKAAVTIGMGMTERQGGTDLRANTTRAERVSGKGAETYVITGHKWFLSAPMSDAFLVLAQAKVGLTCFLVPRLAPDGTVNGIRLERLKDKLGTRSNASAEVVFDRALGWRVGEEGRGIATILDMVTLTRLDCAVASAGLMRQALARSLHHASYRTVFQKRLIDQPMMRSVLADMALDVEAATALSFRLARAFDGGDDEDEAAYRRLMTPVTKFWVCKIAPAFAYEAMECHGGNGYVEEGGMPRLYRETPVNAIWEGSGNVMGLDVLRVGERAPEMVGRVLTGLAAASRGEPMLEAGLDRVRTLFADAARNQGRARCLIELLALTTAGALLRAHAPSQVSDSFIATRLGGGFRQTYGAGLGSADTRTIAARAAPQMP